MDSARKITTRAKAPQDQDAALLLRIRDGDHDAFAILLQKHHGTFYRLAYRYLHNREEAQDLVQTAFLRLWEFPDKWDPDKGVKFTTWFYRIVANLCLDSKKQYKMSPLPEHFDIEDTADGQEADAIRQQNQAVLDTYLLTLPERQRLALILCFYQELPHKEAAHIMKVSIKALRSLLMRAKTTLRIQLEPLLQEGAV